ncbi:hypothetical protein BJ165DRAFT_325528 [Panaeolus papilionaceus]|nr:hypothetical protein BJ165DRAFT_325528 [Panaeolus papilionaceus]
MLIENTDIERRLRKERFDTVGSHDLPNYEHIRTMRYVRAFMNGMSAVSIIMQHILLTLYSRCRGVTSIFSHVSPSHVFGRNIDV